MNGFLWLSDFPNDITKILRNCETLVMPFNEFKQLKVLVVGEIIIDQYFFCEAMGKSGTRF